jgi:hypothetical protein
MPIVLHDVESDDDTSEVDFGDVRADSINQDADSFKATTPFSPSPPCHHDPDRITSGPTKLSKTNVKTEIIEAENGHRPRRHNQSGCQIA